MGRVKDYEHWPQEADDDLLEDDAEPASGYDTHNGMHRWTYHRADSPEEAPKKSYAQPAPTYTYPQQAVPYAAPQPQYAYGYAPVYAPVYYGYPAGSQPYQPYQPAEPVLEKKPKKESKTLPWKGRTKAEIEHDNMIIAAREGAFAKRKMEPVGMAPDQMVWCVEVNGEHTLRTYVTVKGFKGEWKPDPRYEDAWYFVRSS